MQHRNPADLIRGLRAQYVTSNGGDAQEDGANIPEAFNWLAFARDTAQYFKHAPGLSCMLGPMDAEPKVRQCLIGQWVYSAFRSMPTVACPAIGRLAWGVHLLACMSGQANRSEVT